MDNIIVGIDVAKDRLDVAVRPSGELFVAERNAGGPHGTEGDSEGGEAARIAAHAGGLFASGVLRARSRIRKA